MVNACPSQSHSLGFKKAGRVQNLAESQLHSAKGIISSLIQPKVTQQVKRSRSLSRKKEGGGTCLFMAKG